jgi:MFS family permease
MNRSVLNLASPSYREAGPPEAWKAGSLVYSSGALVALFFWLLVGDFAWSMRDRSVGPMAQWYLTQLKVPNFLFALLISSFPALIGLVLGPVISVKSDRHRGKWGRRIPFLLVTTPLAALGMIGLGATPLLARWVHGHFPGQDEQLISILCFGVFWASFEFATIAGQAVFGGLINDVVPRPLLGRFFGLFRAVSLIDGMIFNFWIMGKVPEYYTLILLVVGVFYGCAFTWVCLKVREGEYPPPPARAPGSAGILAGFWREAVVYLSDCFAKPYYVFVFLLMTVSMTAFTSVNTFGIPYSRSLGIGMDTYGKMMALIYLISLGLSFFIGWLADLFHPLRMVMATLGAYVALSFWAAAYATTPGTFLTAWVLHGVLSGCYFTGSASLGQRLFPHAKFAQFASAAGILIGLGTMVAAPAMGTLIDWSGNAYHYVFALGSLLALAALVVSVRVYRLFLEQGGPRNYVAPE